MLLIFPPVSKACEPPAGITRLAGALRQHGLNCQLLDANLEGQLWLLRQSQTADDTWSRRAYKGRADNLAALRDGSTYRTPGRYRRAVSDLNRSLNRSVSDASTTVSLSDYQHAQLSPLRSSDLLTATIRPEQNPFYPYFSRRLPELLQATTTVGFSLNYLSQAFCTFAMIGYVRREFPGVKIVLGEIGRAHV